MNVSEKLILPNKFSFFAFFVFKIHVRKRQRRAPYICYTSYIITHRTKVIYDVRGALVPWHREKGVTLLFNTLI